MKELEKCWKEDKLKLLLHVLWLLTVLTSFWGSEFLAVSVPAIGQLYPFRLLLPATALLYLIRAIREKENPWKDSGLTEKLCYILAAVLVVYGGISLGFAIDFGFTFRRLFNLCFDLVFFLLALRLCRDQQLLKKTVAVTVFSVVILCAAGVYEIFCGGIFNTAYDNFKRLTLFYGVFQYPVVTAFNTNDFATMLAFALTVVLVWWSKAYSLEKKRLWIPLLLLPLCFFLVTCTSSRLVMAAMWILLAGVALFFLFEARRHLWVPAVILVLFLCVNFVNRYYYVKPALDNYVQSVIAQWQQPGDQQGGAQNKPPKLDLTRPDGISLKDELTETDEQGNVTVNNVHSGGVRIGLLIHSADCFLDSYGMGVGMGNTEQLARTSIAQDNGGIWSIHCFLARLVADCGIWALIPLAWIALRLLFGGCKAWFGAIRRKEKKAGMWLIYLAAVLNLPIVSTASSDAQDIFVMWLFLAILVLQVRFDSKKMTDRKDECTL